MVLCAATWRVSGGDRHIGLLLTILMTWVAYCNGKTFAKRMYDVFMNMDDNEIV